MATSVPSTSPPAAPSPPAVEEPVTAAAWEARAQLLLAHWNVDGYRELLADVGRLADPQRRYHARLVVLRRGLEAAGHASAAVATAILTVVAAAAVSILEVTPSEPLVLESAASALRALGYAGAAQALAQAAHRLDPAIGHIRPPRPLPTEAPADAAVAPAPVSALAPAAELARRAVDVAGRAQPATGLTLSLCMIVRDEEEMLHRCLEAIAPVVDEIVIVDTGSLDATIEIARSFGAIVIEHQWSDSFAEARNVAHEAATGDWIIFLDADQVVESADVAQLRTLTGHTWREGFYLVETSYLGEADDGFASTDNTLRVVRNRPAYRFAGRVHEQITHALPMYAPGRIHQTDIRVHHYGYLESVRGAKAKSQRNIDLLHRQADEGEDDAFLHFNLGTEHAANGDVAAAVEAFERAWAMIVAQGAGVDYRYGPQLVARLVDGMRESGRHADAAALAAEGLRRYPGFTDLVFAQARVAFETGAFEAARRHYRRCIELGDAPDRYQPIVGSGTYLPRIALAQLALQDGEDTEALALLGWCLEHHPTFPAAVVPYLGLLLRAGVPVGDAVAAVEQRLGIVTPHVRLTLAGALNDLGALPDAERQYRAVLAEQPDHAATRLGLSEMLLRAGDPRAAAEQASRVPAGHPAARAAARIELCGLVCAGDLTAAPAALTRVGALLSSSEHEVFSAWLGLACGHRAPALSRAAMAPLAELLEGLLQSRSFVAFEQLIPALMTSELPERDRRELLADMYLRHGFLASAAQEWMAVCAQAPDAPALAGLARVALGNQQLQDAAVFAQGALELDPDNAAAADILTRLCATAAAR